MRFLLIHSPLVGPATWQWIASELDTNGHQAIRPDLRSAVLSGQPQAVIDAAAAAVPATWSKPIVIGHSGAGFLLPSIADRIDAAQAIFVDAGLPPDHTPATAGTDIVDHLRSLAVDRTLPRWSTWWGPDLMRTLVPDETKRLQIDEELPEVPLSYYETPTAIPNDWERRPSAYLLLSGAYRADAAKARSLGWPVTECMGGHLDIVNTPEAIAERIVDLAQAAET